MRSVIQRTLGKRIRRALELLDAPVDGDTGERIHEVRKQLKGVRALLHLIRPETGRKRCDRTDRQLRKVMHALATARDATILLETFLQLAPRARLAESSLARFRLTLDNHRNQAHQNILASSKDRGHLREPLRKVRKDILDWPAIAEDWQAISPGLKQIYRAAATAAAATSTTTEQDDEALHETRKRAKELLHVLELVEPMSSSGLESRIRVIRELTGLLGKDHDLAVLGAILEGPLRRQLMRDELRRLSQIVATRRGLLQHRASAACAILVGSDDAEFLKEMRRSWKQRHGRKARLIPTLTGHSRGASVNARIFSGLER